MWSCFSCRCSPTDYFQLVKNGQEEEQQQAQEEEEEEVGEVAEANKTQEENP